MKARKTAQRSRKKAVRKIRPVKLFKEFSKEEKNYFLENMLRECQLLNDSESVSDAEKAFTVEYLFFDTSDEDVIVPIKFVQRRYDTDSEDEILKLAGGLEKECRPINYLGREDYRNLSEIRKGNKTCLLTGDVELEDELSDDEFKGVRNFMVGASLFAEVLRLDETIRDKFLRARLDGSTVLSFAIAAGLLLRPDYVNADTDADRIAEMMLRMMLRNLSFFTNGITGDWDDDDEDD